MALTNQTPESQVQQTFDQIADHYDTMNNWISLGTQNHWRRVVNQHLNIQPGDRVLDLCCGTGIWTMQLAEMVGPRGQVVGVDFSKEMLGLAQQKISDSGLTNIQLINSDVQNLPLAGSSFDAVVIGFGLRNVPDANQVLREMHRVLKVGGQAVCLETSQPTQPILHLGWDIYVRQLMPLMGAVIHRFEQYDYLQHSTHQFVSALKLKKMFVAAGFRAITFQTFFAGAAAAHYGYK